jgi:bile acid:Na+ symporter, BASS family
MNPEKVAAIVMLVSLMLSAGLEINVEHLLAALKNYGLIARALLANFIVIPIFGVLLARAFHLDQYVAIGFVLMALAPGVPFLVRAAGRTPGGSLGFAAALAFILPALSIVTIPLTARFIFAAGLIAPAAVAGSVPFGRIAVTLFGFQLIPLLVGLLIANRAPKLAIKLRRPLLLLFVIAVVALLVILGPILVKAVAAVYGSHGMWAILVLVLLSVGTGWILGGPSIQYRRTLSIATMLRNIGTCAVVATATFPKTLVAPTVLTYFIFQFLISIIFRVYFHRGAARATAA